MKGRKILEFPHCVETLLGSHFNKIPNMPQGGRERKRKVNFAAQLLFAVDQMQHLSFEMMKRDYLLERRRTEFVRKITLQYFLGLE